MKKILILLLAFCTISASAQTRRPVSKSKTTTQAKKPATTANKNPQSQKAAAKKDPAEAVARIGYDVTWPLWGIVLNNEKIPFGEPGNFTGKVLLRTYYFDGGYKTVMAECDQEDINKQLGHKETLFWTGKNIECSPQNNNEMYLIFKRYGTSASASTKRGGSLTYVKEQKLAVLQVETGLNKEGNFCMDMWRGMSVSEVSKKLSALRGLKFEQAGTENGLNVYVAKWYQMTDDYRDIYGTTHFSINTDKEYGRFFFDANGKLVIFYFKL